MLMKLRAGERRDHRDAALAVVAFSVAVVIRTDHFTGVRHIGPPPTYRAPEICCMVFRNVCADSNRAGLADVPVFALTTRLLARIAAANSDVVISLSSCGVAFLASSQTLIVVPDTTCSGH